MLYCILTCSNKFLDYFCGEKFIWPKLCQKSIYPILMLEKSFCNGAGISTWFEWHMYYFSTETKLPGHIESTFVYGVTNPLSRDVRNWLISIGFFILVAKIFEIFGFDAGFDWLQHDSKLTVLISSKNLQFRHFWLRFRHKILNDHHFQVMYGNYDVIVT